jgi:DNA polymerase
MRFCLIDFETKSACDLKKAGAWRYAEDPTTDILCLGYTFGNVNTVLTPADLNDPEARSFLMAGVLDPECMFIAHNVAFEKAHWRNIMMGVYGWPDIPDERWHDIMASCALKGLPLKLERAAHALGLVHQKDTEGTKATLALGRVNKKGYYTNTLEKLRRVYDYNLSDLDAELELHRAVKGLGATERNVWLLDQRINQRGVRLDLSYIDASQAICDAATKPLIAEFIALTGIKKIGSPKFKDWLQEQGCPFPRDKDGNLDTSLDKEHVAKLLGVENDEESDDSIAGDEEDYQDEERQIVLPYSFLRPLEIRKVLGSASIKKLASMQACVCSNGRALGLLQYHGAGPGRWAGRLLQPQNFPCPTLKVDDKPYDPAQLVDAILTRDAEYVRMLFGEPIEAVASGLRHCLIAADGKLFEVGDFATIEARIVLAIAGQYDKLDLIVSGKDIYIAMAQDIYGVPVDKKRDPEKRDIGKRAVLGCGFQMGWRKFKKRYAQTHTDEFCEKVIKAYREDFAPEVPKLWRALEDAAVRAVWDRTPIEAYGIVYQLEDRWLTARLHDGKKLYYYDPKPVRKHMPWSTPEEPDIRRGFEYSAWKMGQWKRVSAYGGLLTENVVQATARQLLVNGMFNAEREGHPIVLTVHDEILCEVPESLADAKLLDAYMTDVPEWAKQLRIPVNSECWVGDRYRK